MGRWDIYRTEGLLLRLRVFHFRNHRLAPCPGPDRERTGETSGLRMSRGGAGGYNIVLV